MIMPFGFEQRQAEEKYNQRQEEDENKIYLTLTATYERNGALKPLSFIWEDDLEYKIDRVFSCTGGQSLKNYCNGLRYRCQTGRRFFDLYYEIDTNRWYIKL